MLGRHPLVAEELAELVDVLQPADDRPLQVELGRRPQEQLAVECVVVGGERPRRGAAGQSLQDRRFQLDEVALNHVGADRRHQLRARLEDLARALVGHQVELALAVARLDVGDPVEEVGRVAQRLRQQHALADADRQLAAFGHMEDAVDADQIADVEFLDPPEGLLAELVATRVGLDRAADVADVEEGGLAVAALAGHPAPDAVGELLVLTLPQLRRVVRRVDLLDPGPAFERVRVGIDPGLAQALDLRPPLIFSRAAGRAIPGRHRLRRSLAHRPRACFMERSRQSPARHLHSREG